jgi:hypothetical protein
MAKDVAAFANHLGGTLLLGAVETDEILRKYFGMTPQEAGKAIRSYSDAAADRCWPRPVLDPACYEDPSDSAKKIVAINVEPSLELVCVKVKADLEKEKWGDYAYVFPVRTGNNARYLQPGQLAMFMTPHVRRIAVMASKIPKGELVKVRVPAIGNDIIFKFSEVLEDQNLLRVEIVEGGPGPTYPLDCVRTVYEAWDPNAKRLYWRLIMDDVVR